MIPNSTYKCKTYNFHVRKTSGSIIKSLYRFLTVYMCSYTRLGRI